jgi:hypothetical protein
MLKLIKKGNRIFNSLEAPIDMLSSDICVCNITTGWRGRLVWTLQEVKRDGNTIWRRKDAKS